MRETPWSKNQGTKQRVQRILEDCWQWETNGQCVKGDNCSFRHDINKRAKTTQPNPSPSSSTRQNETNASRTRSPRGKRPSGRMFRLPCKDYLKCCNCRVLNLVSTCFGVFCFPSVPCPLAVAMVFHVGNNWTHSFLLRKFECFKHALW